MDLQILGFWVQILGFWVATFEKAAIDVRKCAITLLYIRMISLREPEKIPGKLDKVRLKDSR